MLSNTNSKKSLLVEIGFTERGMEDIGDVLLLNKAWKTTENNDIVQRGTTLLLIEWEGHSITGADELYHTVWENFSGVSEVVTPLSGVVEEINHKPSPQLWFDEDTILAKVVTTEEEWSRAQKERILVKEPEYIRHVQGLPRGLFAESEDEFD
jgi:glycine cleavage system H lipoate-binding protein